MKKLITAVAIATFSIVPASVDAQSYQLCGNGSNSTLCFGWNVDATGSTILIKTWNASAPSLNGDIEDFAFWGLGSGSLLNKSYISGTSAPLSAWGGAVSSELANAITNPTYLGVGFSNAGGNKGMTVDPSPQFAQNKSFYTSGPTGDYLLFEFSKVGVVGSMATGAAFRAQSTGLNGENSFKCISSANFGGQNNCSTDGIVTITSVVPEPSTYALMASGLLGIFGFARRRRNNA